MDFSCAQILANKSVSLKSQGLQKPVTTYAHRAIQPQKQAASSKSGLSVFAKRCRYGFAGTQKWFHQARFGGKGAWMDGRL